MSIAKHVSLLVLLFQVSCTGIGAGKIPDTEILLIAPFTDGPEAFGITTVTKIERDYNPKETEELMPSLIAMRASDWNKWRKFSLKVCRLAIKDQEECNLKVKSVGRAIDILDNMAKVFKEGN